MKALITLLFLVFSSLANANDLENAMKSVGEQFKILAVAMQVGQVSDSELNAIETLQRSASQAALIYPDTATTIDKKLLYVELMTQLNGQSLKLEDEIKRMISEQDSNLAEYANIIRVMNEIRIEAHEEFKVD